MQNILRRKRPEIEAQGKNTQRHYVQGQNVLGRKYPRVYYIMRKNVLTDKISLGDKTFSRQTILGDKTSWDKIFLCDIFKSRILDVFNIQI
jgi:hypothetical protein